MTAVKEASRPRLIPSKRFTLALLVSFGLFIQYAQRLSLSICIVCMVNKTKIDIASEITSNTTIIKKYGSQFLQEKQFFLNEFQQQILLGAYWLGNIISLLPGNKSAWYFFWNLSYIRAFKHRQLAFNEDRC